MQDSVPEGAQCLICHEGLLSQAVCALVCGHVYHYSCFQQWLASASKGKCPTCRVETPAGQLRILEFEVAEVQPESYEEVRWLEGRSAEARGELREELRGEEEAVRAQLREVGEELAEQAVAAQELRRARKGHEDEARESEASATKLRERLGEKLMECAQVQAYLDAEAGKHLRKLPIPRSREEDPDVQEERRKLRVVRPGDRSRQLHEAVVSARRLEAEAGNGVQERQRAIEEAQAELKKLRRTESALRRELSALNDATARDWEACSRQNGSQSGAAHAREAQLQRAESRETAASTAPAAVGSPAGASAGTPTDTPGSGRAEAQAPEDWDMEDADILYGGGGPRRGGARGGARVAAGGGGFMARAALASQPPPSGAPASIAHVTTPARTQGAMQALFSKRRP